MELLVKPLDINAETVIDGCTTECLLYIEVGYNADCEFCIDCSGLGI